MPSFQPSGASPDSMRRRRSVSCASIPRSILGSLAMAAILPRRGTGAASGDVEEADRDVAEADLVAVGEDGLAVEAAVVEDHDDLAARGDHGVPAGDGEVLEHDVGGRGAPEAQRPGPDLGDDDLVAVLYCQVTARGETRNREGGSAAVPVAGAGEVAGGQRGDVGGRSLEGRHGGKSPGRT